VIAAESTGIGGVKIELLNKKEILRRVHSAVANNQKLFLVSANSELIYQAASDIRLKEILSSAVCFAESVGLKLVNKQVKEITPGIELAEELLKSNYRIYLFGSSPEVIKMMAQKYPKIAGYSDGYQQLKSEDDTRAEIRRLKPDIILVGLGGGKQEKWIDKYLSELPVKVALGVGGSFDVLSGKKKRSPRTFRSLGLEWLYRIIIGLRFKRALRLLGFLKVSLFNKN